MRPNDLRATLLRHLGGVDFHPERWRISRRAFLGGLATFGASARGAAGTWTFEPVVLWRRGVLTVTYAGREWVLDSAAFGPRARLTVRHAADGSRISLQHALWPGTQIAADFICNIQKSGREWVASIEVPMLRTRREMVLTEWLDGRPVFARLPRSHARVGNSRLQWAAGTASLTAQSGLTLTLATATRLLGPVNCTATGTTLCLARSELLPDESLRGWSTHLGFNDPVMRPRGYACGNADNIAIATPIRSEVVTAEFFETNDGHAQALLIKGTMRLELRKQGQSAPVPMERGVLMLSANRIGIAGSLAGAPFAIRSSQCVATLTRTDAPFCAIFEAGEAPSFSVAAQASELRFAAEGLDLAAFTLPAAATTLATAMPASAYGGQPKPGNHIIVGDRAGVLLDLDEESLLTVRYGGTLLNLRFQFVGFSFDTTSGSPILRRRIGPNGSCVAGWIAIHFPPQHISETIQQLDDASVGCPTPSGAVEQYFSQSSRIVFSLSEDKPGKALWHNRDVTLANLLNWADLRLSVHDRAKSLEKDPAKELDTQISLSGIAKDDDLSTAIGIIAAGRGPIMPDMTSLELVDGLVFSPSKEAIFETSPIGPSGGLPSGNQRTFPMFGVRMGRANDPVLRALSSRLIASQLPSANDLAKPTENFRPLSVQEHWEIIGQTSTYGLPALRRDLPVDDGKHSPMGVRTDPGNALAKVPRGNVVRPTQDYRYLRDVDAEIAAYAASDAERRGEPPPAPRAGPPPEEAGIALATSFQTADVTLTGLGATMRIDWRGEPASLRPNVKRASGVDMPPGFQLERLAYQSWLGRDVRVLAVTKGYLIPLGLRASLIKISERVFMPEKNRVVAREVQRRFIVAPRTPKYFPAVGQPDGGRDFPVDSLTLVTNQTPDLLEMSKRENGSLNIPGLVGLGAFWPRYRLGDGAIADVAWNVLVDKDPTPLVVPMIFIPSAAADNPIYLENVIAVYNGALRDQPGLRSNWPATNVAAMGGARRTYAPPASSGATSSADTAFETESWLLTARGRGLPLGGESFLTDARMNSVDQPAFYPSIRRANIAIQSVDRLVGAPQGLVEADLFPGYVKSGFGTPRVPVVGNKGEVFLQIVGRPISLDPAAAGSASTGGIAQPKSQVVGLSRISGVVGGSPDRAPLVARASPLDDALSGRFDPKNFFKLKIFGVDLVDYISAQDDWSKAPRLSETIDYGVDDALLDRTLRPLAVAVRDSMAKLRTGIDNGITAFEGSLPTHTPPFTFATLYPDLSAAYHTSIDGILAQLTTLSAAPNALAVASTATQLTIAAKPLIVEVGKAVRNPIPQQISEEIDTILDQWERLKTLFQNLPQQVASGLDLLLKRALAAFEKLADEEIALIFGIPKTELDVATLATNADVRRRLSATLLYENVGSSVLRTIDKAMLFAAEINGTISFDRTPLETAAGEAIRNLLIQYADRLIDEASATANILREDDVRRLTFEIAAALIAELQRLSPKTSVEEGVGRLRSLADSLKSGGKARASLVAVSARIIDAHLTWILTVDPADQAAVQAAIKARLSTTTGDAAANMALDIVTAVLPMVELRANRASDAILGTVVDALTAPLECAKMLIDLVAVAGPAASIPQWCSAATGGFVELATAFADGLLSAQASIDSAVQAIDDQANAIVIPADLPAALSVPLSRIRSAILANVALVRAASQALGEHRNRLVTLPAASTCSGAPAIVFQEVVKARGAVVVAVRGIAAEIAALDALVASANDPLGVVRASYQPQIQALIIAVRQILVGATVVGGAGQSAPWTQIVAPRIDELAAIGPTEFKTRIAEAKQQIMASAQTLSTALNAATAADLPALTLKAVELTAIDQHLSAALLETFAVTESGRDRLENIALILARGVAGPMRQLHKDAFSLFVPLTDLADNYPALAYLLGSSVDEFRQAVGKIAGNVTLLTSIADATTYPAAKASIDDLLSGWKGGNMPLLAATKSLAAMIDLILEGQFGHLLGDAVRGLFKDLQFQLEQVVSQFIPTKVHTQYNWATTLKNKGEVFRIPDDSSGALTIDSQISFDFLKNERSAVVIGTLAEFDIVVPGLFTIQFSGATFKSENGSTPNFRAEVKNFIPGDALRFLQEIQKIVAPSGNGLYVRPRADGIKVGYAFAKDQLQIGSITLSNIALDVYADLPFKDHPSEFGFLFASREKPFLISNPPYGGGGWLAIRGSAGGKTQIELSFMFGAVTDIAFGPLKGHGRICAGIEYQSDRGVLTAFVEAVGEGHIACFSIGIYIGIFLTHYTDTGNFVGEARYEFKFKVGFVTLKYGVTARYRINRAEEKKTASTLPDDRHDAKPQGFALADLLPAALDILVPPVMAATVDNATRPPLVLQIDVPVKSVQWNRYRQLISLELLDA